jgi:hypothetical protein
MSDSSSAAADAATAAPADWPTVSADRMAVLVLSLLKSTAPAGVNVPRRTDGKGAGRRDAQRGDVSPQHPQTQTEAATTGRDK